MFDAIETRSQLSSKLKCMAAGAATILCFIQISGLEQREREFLIV